jgi:hypothetical protein
MSCGILSQAEPSTSQIFFFKLFIFIFIFFSIISDLSFYFSQLYFIMFSFVVVGLGGLVEKVVVVSFKSKDKHRGT